MSRRLYLTSARAARALRTSGLRALAAGVKAFEKEGSAGVGCSYRLVQEGALLLRPYLGRRVVEATPQEVAALVEARTIDLPVQSATEVVAVAEAPPAPLVTLASRLAKLWPNGSCMVTCDNGCGSARTAAVLMK